MLRVSTYDNPANLPDEVVTASSMIEGGRIRDGPTDPAAPAPGGGEGAGGSMGFRRCGDGIVGGLGHPESVADAGLARRADRARALARAPLLPGRAPVRSGVGGDRGRLPGRPAGEGRAVTDPLSHVRHILTAAETGAPLAPSTVQWLAAGFQAITWDTRRRLEAALGITARGGLPGMSRQQRMDARDRMLQELRALFYPEWKPARRPARSSTCVTRWPDRT